MNLSFLKRPRLWVGAGVVAVSVMAANYALPLPETVDAAATSQGDDWNVVAAYDQYRSTWTTNTPGRYSALVWDGCFQHPQCIIASPDRRADHQIELTVVPAGDQEIKLQLRKFNGDRGSFVGGHWTRTFSKENPTHTWDIDYDNRMAEYEYWGFRLDPFNYRAELKVLESHLRIRSPSGDAVSYDPDFTRWWEYDVHTERWQDLDDADYGLMSWDDCHDADPSTEYTACSLRLEAGYAVDWYVGVQGQPAQRLRLVRTQYDSDGEPVMSVVHDAGHIANTPGRPGAFIQGRYETNEDQILSWQLCSNNDSVYSCDAAPWMKTQIALDAKPRVPHRPTDRTVRYEPGAAVLEFTSPENIPVTYARGRVGNDACQGWGRIRTEDGNHLLTHVGGNNYEIRIPYASYGMNVGSNRCVDVKPCNESGCYHRDGRFRNVIRPAPPAVESFNFVGDRRFDLENVMLDIDLTPADATFSRIDGFYKKFKDEHGSNCHNPAYGFGPMLPADVVREDEFDGLVSLRIPYSGAPADRSYCLYVQAWNEDGAERVRRWTKVDLPNYTEAIRVTADVEDHDHQIVVFNMNRNLMDVPTTMFAMEIIDPDGNVLPVGDLSDVKEKGFFMVANLDGMDVGVEYTVRVYSKVGSSESTDTFAFEDPDSD